jgi:uncharacterized protein YvpB
METLLTYKYKSQRDNKYYPGTTCNVTSLAMGLSCLGLEVDEDELYLKANSTEYIIFAKKLGTWLNQYVLNKKLNQVWAILEKLADEYIGNEDGGTFKDNWLSFNNIEKELDQGHPVLISGQFTHGGHIVCVVGYNSTGLICADPWGDWTADYKNQNGKDVLYPYEKLRPILNGKDGYFRALVLKK